MKKNLFLWQVTGFIFVCGLGTLLHFLYEWSNGSVIASVFSTVNESTWEHMKILFVPMFIFALIEKHLIGVELKNYWCVKLCGMSLGVVLIPIIFYSYNGIFGPSKAWINIAIFYVSAAITFIYEYKRFKKEKTCCMSQNMAFALVCLIALAFLIFTFVQPQIPVFQDPITGGFGA